MDLSDLENLCGYVFKDKNLLKKSVTLSSYNHVFNNQSLECLGDSILAFIVSEKYYKEGYTEGEITAKKQQLLSDEALRPVSEKLGLENYLIRDKGDSHNKKSVPSAYEALTAAIYLDGGMRCAKKFVLSTLAFSVSPINYVGKLQEYFQGKGMPLPVYATQSIGTVHAPRFKVTLTFGQNVFSAEGDNISSAKRAAAQMACSAVFATDSDR